MPSPLLWVVYVVRGLTSQLRTTRRYVGLVRLGTDLGVTVAFRGGRTGPQAPGRFCEFWPCETMWSDRKVAVRKMIEKSKKVE